MKEVNGDATGTGNRVDDCSVAAWLEVMDSSTTVIAAGGAFLVGLIMGASGAFADGILGVGLVFGLVCIGR